MNHCAKICHYQQNVPQHCYLLDTLVFALYATDFYATNYWIYATDFYALIIGLYATDFYATNYWFSCMQRICMLLIIGFYGTDL